MDQISLLKKKDNIEELHSQQNTKRSVYFQLKMWPYPLVFIDSIDSYCKTCTQNLIR